MKPRVMIIVGAALLASAVLQAGLAVYFQGQGQEAISTVLWWITGADALLGGGFLLSGVRKAGGG